MSKCILIDLVCHDGTGNHTNWTAEVNYKTQQKIYIIIILYYNVATGYSYCEGADGWL